MAGADLTKVDDAGDGRTRRRTRSRERILEALVDLVREGDLMPTAEQVAERASVGTRTVFRLFADMEALYAEMSALVEREVRPLLEGPAPGGSLEERARALVERRSALFERIAPFKRSGNLRRWHSPFLQNAHAAMVRELRADLLQTLPELASAPEPRLEALDLATSFEAWSRLRSDQHLGRDRARDAVEASVLAILGDTR